MAAVIDLNPALEGVEFITQRRSTTRLRSATLGRNPTPEPEIVEPEQCVDLTIDNDCKTGYHLSEGEWALATFRVRRENQLLRAGDCIKIQPLTLGNYNITFLLIQLITEDVSGLVSIRGIPLARNLDLLGKLPRKSNEVCRVLQYDNNDLHPALLSIEEDAFIKKCDLIFTNTLYPQHHGSGRLVCRWDFKIYAIKERRSSKPVEEVLERIQAKDVSGSQYRQDDTVLCQAWRGHRVPGGSWPEDAVGGPSPVSTINLDEPIATAPTHRQPGQKYTLFDSFAGAGGVSRGAQMSGGFKVTHAVDKAAEVWQTYQTNFRDTHLYKCSVDEFIVRTQRDHIRVDILHLSPPCQYFSPAHTHQAAHDDENIFALYSCNALINKVRPRLITVEETFGITHDRHKEYFHGFINDFTQYGYSVRWKVVRLCTWGSAQDRKRLIMIAAAPGEKLPPFPKPTHSELGRGRAGGMKPFTTIRKALANIRRGDDLHDLQAVKRFQPHKASYNPDRLAGTITTGGADFVYFDGSRDFTLREFASLQGFPKSHRFKGNKTSIKRQIGNAFPPNTVKVLYQHLEKWLLEQDNILPHETPAPDIVMLDDHIVVDDSDEPSDRSRSSSSGSPEVEMIDLIEVDPNVNIRHYASVESIREGFRSLRIDLT